MNLEHDRVERNMLLFNDINGVLAFLSRIQSINDGIVGNIANHVCCHIHNAVHGYKDSNYSMRMNIQFIEL